MALTANGYISRTETEYYNYIIKVMTGVFPEMSIRDDNPLVVLAKIMAKEFSNNEYHAQSVYNNAYVSTASGYHLDKAVRIAGISRTAGTHATVYVTLNKNTELLEDTLIPANLELTLGDSNFICDNSGSLVLTNASPNVTLQAVAEEIGNEVGGANSMNTVNPIAGLDSVTHSAFDSGTDVETDNELRDRYFTIVESFNNSSLEGIISYVLANTEAVLVTGRENTGLTTDADGVPAKSFEVFVAGGVDADIADKIFESKPAGISSHGTESVTVNYNSKDYDIKFSRITETPIYVDLVLSTLPEFPTGGSDIIKTAIQEYINLSNRIVKNQLERVIYTAVDGINQIVTLKFDDVDPPVNEINMNSGIDRIFTSDISDIDIAV